MRPRSWPPLLALLCLALAGLACDQALKKSIQDPPEITSVTVSPKSGKGPFTATATLVNYTDGASITCHYPDPAGRDSLTITSPPVDPDSDDAFIYQFSFDVNEAGNYAVDCLDTGGGWSLKDWLIHGPRPARGR